MWIAKNSKRSEKRARKFSEPEMRKNIAEDSGKGENGLID
jgi:hypothetical protein